MLALPFARAARVLTLTAACAVALACLTAAKNAPIRKLTLDPDARIVELFDGLDENVFAARVSAKNEFVSNVFLTNTTDEPLTVAIPKAIAAVHVLKQFQQPNNNANPFDGQNNGNGQGSGQAVGGQANGFGNNGFPGGNNAQGNQQFPGNNFFSIPPEKTVQFQLKTVCLDHGKPTPRRTMKYVLRRLPEVTANPALQQLLEDFKPGKTDQKALQAAAWHLSNGLSWKSLTAKREVRLALPSKPYFTREQLANAKQMVELVTERAKQRPDSQRVVRRAVSSSR